VLERPSQGNVIRCFPVVREHASFERIYLVFFLPKTPKLSFMNVLAAVEKHNSSYYYFFILTRLQLMILNLESAREDDYSSRQSTIIAKR
jgi:hypothetical protein